MMDENKIVIYTDGAVSANGSKDSKCGWACRLMYKGHVKDKFGSDIGRTNNQMEMIAVLNALRSVTDKTIETEVISDSKYVVCTLNGEYAVGANADLWGELLMEYWKFANIKATWVKGHNGNPNNEAVDALAVRACNNT